MTSPRPLSPTLRDQVAVDRHSRPPIRRLARTQVDTLLAIVHGDDRFPEPVSIRRALTVLAGGAQPEIAVPVLDEVAADVTADRPDRVSAVRELARVGTSAAQASLLSRVRDPDPRVQQAALAALGQCGDRAAGVELARVRQPSDLAARRQLHFARALIAHRSGAGDAVLPPVEAARGPFDGPTTLQLRRRTPAESTADRAAVVGSTYGIEPAAAAYRIVCDRTRWTLLTNAALGDSIEPERLAARPWIVGLLCRWLPPRVAAATQYVLLGRPDRAGVRLEAVRSDGTVVYAGRGSTGDQGFDFDLSEVPRPGAAAMRITGRLSPRGALTAAGSSATRRTAAREARALSAR